MLLQRFTKGLSLAVLMLAIAGCASGPRPSGKNVPPPAEGGAPAQEIPAQALTMYEQAAAVMAAGDFLDAELRFKEFLLQYPAYPGAHVNLAIIHARNGNDEAARAAVDAALAWMIARLTCAPG